MEEYDLALEAAHISWDMEPWNQWYLGEYLRALRSLGLYQEMLELAGLVRGGGVCRYYLADCERREGASPAPSIEYLIETSGSTDDSAAADACIWLAILARGSGSADSSLLLAARAVELRPEEDFYRCFLSEGLSEAGDTEEARVHLHHLRLAGSTDYSYWRAMATLAEAEGDHRRKIWALRRALSERTCPESMRELGWALYLRGRDLLREGRADSARALLCESSLLGDSGDVFPSRADSLLELLYEYESAISGGD